MNAWEKAEELLGDRHNLEYDALGVVAALLQEKNTDQAGGGGGMNAIDGATMVCYLQRIGQLAEKLARRRDLGSETKADTVFGLPLTAVPHFAGMELEEGWWDVMNTWLVERYGLALISVRRGSGRCRAFCISPRGSPRTIPRMWWSASVASCCTTRIRAVLGSRRCSRTNCSWRSGREV
jgi:hypothetical protein